MLNILRCAFFTTEDHKQHVVACITRTVVTRTISTTATPVWLPLRVVGVHSESAKQASRNKHGSNLSYYRASFFRLPCQTQYDLYQAGMAPLMTSSEVNKLRGCGIAYVRQRFRTVPCMYTTQMLPNGFKAPQVNLRAYSKTPKMNALAGKANKKHQENSLKGEVLGTGVNKHNNDVLPAHPTPADIKTVRKPIASATSARSSQKPRPGPRQNANHPQTKVKSVNLLEGPNLSRASNSM